MSVNSHETTIEVAIKKVSFVQLNWTKTRMFWFRDRPDTKNLKIFIFCFCFFVKKNLILTIENLLNLNAVWGWERIKSFLFLVFYQTIINSEKILGPKIRIFFNIFPFRKLKHINFFKNQLFELFISSCSPSCYG